MVGDGSGEVGLAGARRARDKQAVAAGFLTAGLRQHGVEAFGIAPGGCRCSLVVVGELEGGEGAPQETVAHAGLADDALDAIPHFLLLLSLGGCGLSSFALCLLLLVGSHSLGTGASLGSVGRPEDAVAELDALVVAQGAAELAGDGLRDSGTAGEALVVAPDPVTGVTRRRPA